MDQFVHLSKITYLVKLISEDSLLGAGSEASFFLINHPEPKLSPSEARYQFCKIYYSSCHELTHSSGHYSTGLTLTFFRSGGRLLEAWL